jgi:hypothetical protein
VRLLIWIAFIAALAGARVAVADPELVNVELDAVSSSPCADAIAALDPHGEIVPAPACKRLQKLAVTGLGTVVLERVVASDPALFGYELVLSIERPNEPVTKALGFAAGGCGAGTCVAYKPRSARLVRLSTANGDPAFGVEVESIVEISHTFRDMGAPSSVVEQFRLACASRARVLDCKQVAIGGRGEDCRVIGWHGTAVRYSCNAEAQLVPSRSDDTAGIPEADIEQIQTLLRDVDRVIGDNVTDCASLVTQLDKLIAHDADAVARVHALAKPLPHSFDRELMSSLCRLEGSYTCLANVPAQDALGRLYAALGIKADFHLKPKP